jgi:hypothetical protein
MDYSILCGNFDLLTKNLENMRRHFKMRQVPTEEETFFSKNINIGENKQS